MYKSGFISIVGKPNVGKSTLINTLVGFKVAITAPKPQTTRFNIKGILTTDKYQMVFTDTPGIHKPQNTLGTYMMKGVENSLKNSEIVLMLVDGLRPRIDEQTEGIIKSIKELNKTAILVINKIDKIEKEKLLKIISSYDNYAKSIGLEFKDILPISIFKSDGIDILLKVLEDNLEYGEKIYDEEQFTDMTEREIVEENIREKILANYDDEIPHGVNVVIDSFKERTNVNGRLTYDIDASIICNKKSHKPIIIGEGGSRLNHIRNLSKIDLEKILGVKINLKLWVKVRDDWMDSENYMGNIKSKTN